MKEKPCAHCTSPGLVQTRRSAFAVVSRCPHCRKLFARPLSVVVLDAADARREQTVSSLRADGIRVVAATRIAHLERWPVGEVLVTDAAHATRWWSDVGATHVVVLADTDEERSLAERTGASAVLASGNSAALLSILRAVAELQSVADWSKSGGS